MDLDSLGSCDSGDVVTGIDSMESLLAYTVDKRQRNAEAASPELRKEALLSNTVKRAHRLLSLSHDDSGLMSHDDKIQNYFVDEPFGQDDFTQDTNHADTDEQIDVTNDRVSCQFTSSMTNQSDPNQMQSSDEESHHAAKRKRTEPEVESSPQKKIRVESKMNMSLGESN